MEDALRRQRGVIVSDVGLEAVISADPDSVLGSERFLMGVEERRSQAIVGLEIRVGAVHVDGALAELVVGGHVGREIPGSGKLK